MFLIGSLMNHKHFLTYKFLNSLFTGISVSSVFYLYEPLSTFNFTIGGFLLSIGMLITALFYKYIMNLKMFKLFSILIELLLLLTIGYFLIYNISYNTALIFYITYQVTFVFGSYLVRAETIYMKDYLSPLDTLKQAGYLIGMFVSLLYFSSEKTESAQVYTLYYFLFIVQCCVVLYTILAFNHINSK